MKISDWIKNNLQFMNFNKKTISNLFIILCLGIALIIVADFYKDFLPANKKANQQYKITDQNSTKKEYVNELEDQLSEILGLVQDSGRVSVMITLKSTSEIVPALDKTSSDKVTNENDTEGGTRIINETNTQDKVVFMNEQGGNSKAFVIKELNPEIKGVIVVAEGAKNPKVKLKLSEAVQTVLDIPAYRVSILERN